MHVYRVKLTYPSRSAIGWDDESTITVHGTIKDLQDACIKFYDALHIGPHERMGSDEITEDGRPADLCVNPDIGIDRNMSGEEVLPGPELKLSVPTSFR